MSGVWRCKQVRSASECVGRRRHCRCDRRTHSDAERTCRADSILVKTRRNQHQPNRCISPQMIAQISRRIHPYVSTIFSADKHTNTGMTENWQPCQVLAVFLDYLINSRFSLKLRFVTLLIRGICFALFKNTLKLHLAQSLTV